MDTSDPTAEETVDLWVFGYGSLVSNSSLARTLGRDVVLPAHRSIATLHGFGRRWNYGSLHLRANWRHAGRSVASGIVVSLGLEEADESCNGVIVRVSAGELALLDWRERDYQRIAVTSQVTSQVTSLVSADGSDPSEPHRVFTYVPRPSAISRYERARDEGRAAIRSEYVRLVRQAFGELGAHQLAVFERTTPEPDVPVLDLEVHDTTAAVARAEVIVHDPELESTDDRRPG
jgi:cation transport regulator ChaC